MKSVKAIVLRTAGTNCDKETAFAFEAAGARADLIHVNELTGREKELDPYQILAIPGGFTYGDDIASGKILANELKFGLEKKLRKFIKDGKLIIGICNGFQVLVKAGLLPDLSGNFETVEATLTLNDSDKFEDRWVWLKKPRTGCVWTRGIDDIMTLPVAHGEGKFIPKDDNVLENLKKEGMIVFEYVDNGGVRRPYPHNPNGSVENIAGICDRSGRIFGLMPHPERHIDARQHPSWTRKVKGGTGINGLAIFKNGVSFSRIYL